MKITTKKTKRGATMEIRAETEADKRALTDAVMSGRLAKALEGFNADIATPADAEAAGRREYLRVTDQLGEEGK